MRCKSTTCITRSAKADAWIGFGVGAATGVGPAKTGASPAGAATTGPAAGIPTSAVVRLSGCPATFSTVGANGRGAASRRTAASEFRLTSGGRTACGRAICSDTVGIEIGASWIGTMSCAGGVGSLRPLPGLSGSSLTSAGGTVGVATRFGPSGSGPAPSGVSGSDGVVIGVALAIVVSDRWSRAHERPGGDVA